MEPNPVTQMLIPLTFRNKEDKQMDSLQLISTWPLFPTQSIIALALVPPYRVMKIMDDLSM
jgi:hypothetical protein